MANLHDFVKNGKKIIGVATNFHSLLKELQRPIPTAPEIFIKPTTAYITENHCISIPPGFSLKQEIELGVIIKKTCKFINETDAMHYVGGYCIAFDMTATCKMNEARSRGGSWLLGKGFDTSCPVSPFIELHKIPDFNNVEIWSSVNKEMRQNANINDLIFSIPQIISFISQYITLEANDMILTGSPPGMGPVFKGDEIEGGIKDLINIKFNVC